MKLSARLATRLLAASSAALLAGCEPTAHAASNNHYPLERVISFAAGGDAGAFRRGGWAQPERQFTWTAGHIAQLQFTLARSAQPLAFRLRMRGHVKPPELPFQPVEVFANGAKIAEWQVGPQVSDYVALIADDASRRGGALTIELRIPRAISPQALGVSIDNRTLGVCCWEMEIARAAAIRPPPGGI